MINAQRPRISERRRRRHRVGPWARWVLAGAALLLIALGWSGLWYYAATVAARTLSGWVAREAAAGRIYSCVSQDIAGFPFAIEVHCNGAAGTFKSGPQQLAVTARAVTFTAQVLHPNLLIGDVTAPLSVAESGQPAKFVADWSRATMTVEGIPPQPDRLAVSIDHPRLDRVLNDNRTAWFAGEGAQLQARIVSGSAANHPVIEAIVQLSSLSAPGLHPALAQPLRGKLDLVLYGLHDLAPKTLADRFHEIQQSGGSIEIKSMRLERDDALLIGTGTLTLNAHGKFDGVVNVAIAGLENVVPQLGIDRLISEGVNRLAGAKGQGGGLAALDRIMPGLGSVVLQTTNADVIANLKKMGQPTEIDHRPATILPLRFVDGSAYLAMIPLGQVPPLF